MSEKNTVILIPIYKPQLTLLELTSLTRLLSYLGQYSIQFFGPRGLDYSSYQKILDKYFIKFVYCSFESTYFHDLNTYSLLLKQKKFYATFADFDFMLIYQLDAYIFKNELEIWVDKDYDYMGAPLFNVDFQKKTKYIELWGVGNGGFSLRKIKSFLDTFEASQKDNFDNFEMYEDIFWSFEARKINQRFKVADFESALLFAFDRFPEYCFRQNGGKIPFGCHAWDKNLSYWYELILEDILKDKRVLKSEKKKIIRSMLRQLFHQDATMMRKRMLKFLINYPTEVLKFTYKLLLHKITRLEMGG